MVKADSVELIHNRVNCRDNCGKIVAELEYKSPAFFTQLRLNRAFDY